MMWCVTMVRYSATWNLPRNSRQANDWFDCREMPSDVPFDMPCRGTEARYRCKCFTIQEMQIVREKHLSESNFLRGLHFVCLILFLTCESIWWLKLPLSEFPNCGCQLCDRKIQSWETGLSGQVKSCICKIWCLPSTCWCNYITCTYTSHCVYTGSPYVHVLWHLIFKICMWPAISVTWLIVWNFLIPGYT